MGYNIVSKTKLHTPQVEQIFFELLYQTPNDISNRHSYRYYTRIR